MPTGYTAILTEKPTTFKEFALRCARAFGALIEMRDDDMDAPIPDEFKPSDYHAREMERAKQELARLVAMDAPTAMRFGAEMQAKEIAQAEKWLADSQQENLVYESMQRSVQNWTPPTPDHAELKKFMLEQLETSKRNTRYALDSLVTAKSKIAADYYREAVASAERDISYHEKEQVAEAERARSRSLWVKQLKESL